MPYKISLEGIAFQAMPSSLPSLSKNDIQKESMQKSDVEQEKEMAKNVVFRDPTTGKNVSVDLNADNMERLKTQFSEDNFVQKNNKTYLVGEVEKYVSGWYGDIAYNREFLKADSNEDGQLSTGEYKNTKNMFAQKGEIDIYMNKGEISIQQTLTNSYLSSNDELSSNENSKNLNDELNDTIKIDSNSDGKFMLNEYYKNLGNGSAQEAAIKEFQDLIQENLLIQKAVNTTLNMKKSDIINTSVANFIPKKKKKDKEESEELTQAQQAMQKLIASNGNESVLSAEEKQAIQGEIHAIKKEIDEKDSQEYVLDVRV